MFNFEKLDVWQEAIEFADLMYELTGGFPDEERFGLTNQMRRAAVSISSNLAEGSSRVSRTDFSRFVEIATGSLFEVVSQTTIALRRRMIARKRVQAYLRSSRKAEQNAQRIAQIVVVCDVTLNSQPKTLNRSPTPGRRRGRRGAAGRRRERRLAWAVFRALVSYWVTRRCRVAD